MNLMSKSHWIAAVLLAVGHLASPSSAEKYTAKECSARWNSTNHDGYKPVNSSRSASLSVGNSSRAWHVTTTSSAPWTGHAGELRFDVNLSLDDVETSEEHNGTVLCPYAFSGINKKFEGTRGSNFTKTCDGLLSSKCRETLLRLSTPKNDDECPNLLPLSDAADEIADACDGMTNKQTTTMSPIPLNGSTSYCGIQNFPNILVPEAYDTINLITIAPIISPMDFIDAYDVLSPDDFVADGSRKPQGDSPHGSLDGKDDDSLATSWQPLLSLAVAVMLAACVGLVM